MVMKHTTIDFAEIGRLPHPNDNVAIATRTLDAGLAVRFNDRVFTLGDVVLQGHRFAVQAVRTGENLLSWGQPFGRASAEIAPGDYVRNEGVLKELRRRQLSFTLPDAPNFVDEIAPFVFDEAAFQPAPPLERYAGIKTFMGYRRSPERGVGTRNTLVLLGTSSLTGGFVRTLETKLKPLAEQYPNIDAIVAVAHTEGSLAQPNNRELLLRTLAGFMVNPNVGAVLAVDYGSEAVNNAALSEYLTRNNYPIAEIPHHFMSLSRSFQADLDAASAVVTGWLDVVNSISRTEESICELRIGLQCGGSDAFSGISGNPLLGWVTAEILRYGGSANLAETDELIGAEAYMLSGMRDLATARQFLAAIQRFQEWAGWHGHSAEGNPSGGNKYRGLYNIYLKSLGAAMKRDPAVRVAQVIEYSERMREAGLVFMDSPGNDLESIAGQIAAGCNLIFFVTGNGSITNFPYVPTLKIVTTTERYNLLMNEMDVNAGAYLDGVPMAEVGGQALQLTIDIASGQLSAGERAGHAQVQIWRDWLLTAPADLRIYEPVSYSGEPLAIDTRIAVPDVHISAYHSGKRLAVDQVGLVLPTSLCSGQIAQMCARRLNERSAYAKNGLSRFVALAHTEGCGSATGSELNDTLLGYLRHPSVKYCMLLEHGCEKTHNGYIRQLILEASLDPRDYGWASVQLDGGIEAVIQKMENWFEDRWSADSAPKLVDADLSIARLGLVTQGEVPDQAAEQFALLTRMIAAAGGMVVMSRHDTLLQRAAFTDALAASGELNPTLGYAQFTTTPGFHIMATPARHWGETLTGLGAVGVDLFLAYVQDRPMPGHPLIPLLQVTSNRQAQAAYAADLDGFLAEPSERWAGNLLGLVVETLSRSYAPRLSASGNTQFQITRGLLGISM